MPEEIEGLEPLKTALTSIAQNVRSLNFYASTDDTPARQPSPCSL
jgi:hypothetical protein